MKIHLLLALFVFTSAAGFSQSMRETLDTSFVSTDNGATFSVSMISQHTYDSTCRHIDTTINRYFDASTHKRLNTTRYAYTFNEDGTTHQTLFQLLDTMSNTFVNNGLDVYYYSADGSIVADTDYNWNGSQWVPFALYTHISDTAGNVTSSLNQLWDASQQAFINYQQYVVEYNSAEQITLNSAQNWNAANQVWDHRFDLIYVYDSNNFLVSDTNKNTFYTPTLQTEGYTTYFNNKRGYKDSSVYTSLQFNNHSDSRYIYYPDSVTVRQRYQYDYNPANVLLDSNRTTFYYDSANNVYQYTATVEFANPPSAGFSPAFINYNKSTYNPEGLQISYEYGFGGYDSTGMPVYSTIYRLNQYYSPCPSVLPVTLLSFTADKKDNNAVLQWKTSNETNTASFAVQRSTDGIHFTTIGTIKAAGNSTGQRSYTYTDFNIHTLGTGKVYYRLAQQDINGSVHNSVVAQVDVTGGKLSITISPNPMRNSIGIYSPVAIQNAVIRIADMGGKTVYTSRINLSAGTKFSVDASAFARGVYFVTVQTGTDVQVVKMVKE